MGLSRPLFLHKIKTADDQIGTAYDFLFRKWSTVLGNKSAATATTTAQSNNKHYWKLKHITALRPDYEIFQSFGENISYKSSQNI